MSRRPDAPIRLTRTGWDTFRWYARSRVLRALAALVVVTTLTGAAVANWGWIQTQGADLVTGLARQITGSEEPPAHERRFTVADLRAIAAALSDDVTDSKLALKESAPLLGDDVRAPLAALVDRCELELAAADNWYGMQECTATLSARTAALRDATIAAANAKAAAEAEAARIAAEEAARRAAENTGGRDPDPAPAPEPAPRPDPAPSPGGGGGSTAASTSTSVSCSSAATVTFTSNGHIVVSGAGSGSGNGSVTVSGGAGTYSATATAQGNVSLNVSWSGSCS